MRHFPVFLDTHQKTIVVSGAGGCAIAKLRLLLKTEATLKVFAPTPDPLVRQWAREGRIHLFERPVKASDLADALIFYAANDVPETDRQVAQLARQHGVKTLIVDNLDDSDFITPAIVDRDPVTVAIGTEGAAPVLARQIKADIEAMLPASLGVLARIGKSFRPLAERLPKGRPRRDFWSRFYFEEGPKVVAKGTKPVERVLHRLLGQAESATTPGGRVDFVGAGPGDPDLLTLTARRLLHEADVVIHDRPVPAPILELARREATIIEVGNIPLGRKWSQSDINALLVEHGKDATVVRLRPGNVCSDDETRALAAAGIAFDKTPGITTNTTARADHWSVRQWASPMPQSADVITLKEVG